METKIVVHMKDGTIYKGVTHDFDADRDTFHVLPAEGGGVPRNVDIDAMKALFYVKDYMGNRDFVARRKFEGSEGASRRAVLKFRDGEEIWGYLESTEAEGEADRGFFFYPADKRDNNIRIFVVRSALESMRRVEG